MRIQHLAHAPRLLLGLTFAGFGLNGLLGVFPDPPSPPSAMPFLDGLASAPYFFPLLEATQLVAGIALVANRWVPVALLLLAPIVVHIFAFHLFLSPGLALPTFLLVLELAVAWGHRDAFRPLFRSGSRELERGRVG